MKRKVKKSRTLVRPNPPGWLIVVVLLCTIAFGPQVIKLWKLNNQIKVLEAQKQLMQNKNKYYTEQVKNLQTDKTIEKIAREKLGMIKPGEKVLVEVIPKDNEVQ
ncbi:MAG: FtsB family cell division protein [Acidobacteriota bacterium]